MAALSTDIPIDRVEQYWDRRPCNIRHSPAPVGTRRYFDQVEARKYFVEPHILNFAKFPRWRGKKVLEIGCGIGTDTINFARAGARVTAVDISSESLKVAMKRAQVYGPRDYITFYHGNAEELSSFVPVQSYDLVYSFGAIHHMVHPQRAIEELKKYMAVGSELRIMVYSKVSYKLFQVMREKGVWDMSQAGSLIAENSEAQAGCPVTHTYTFDEVRELLNGFTVTDIHKAHIFIWDVDAYILGIHQKDAAWVNVSDERLTEFERELGWHTLVKAHLCE